MSDERRKSVLTDDDLERIGETFDRRQAQLMEVIGYNISTPESRSEIRKDHEFVRSVRGAKALVLGAFLTAVGAAAAAAFFGVG